MIKRYSYNLKFKTNSIIRDIEISDSLEAFEHSYLGGVHGFEYRMDPDTQIFGLGENVRGINKRGWTYTSFNADDPDIHETRESLYASHNFIIIKDKRNLFGAFFDTPSRITFDLGYENKDNIRIFTEFPLDLYIIESGDILSIVREFREAIGESYIPPVWAFGLCQSRWQYKTKEDVMEIVDGYKKNDLPLDSICLDIDTMDDYKDFTLNDSFGDKLEFIEGLKKENIRLVPIVDAAVKVKEGYDVYEEMIEGNYYCADENGNPYVVGVWPGDSLLPDFLNRDASIWFGSKYKKLLDLGIEGFWNDMNEPALFYSRKHVDEVYEYIGRQAGKNLGVEDYMRNKAMVAGLQNNIDDYKEFYHNVDGEKIRHYDVHNVFGYKMVESASNYFKEYNKDKKYLLYSRSSHIGSHRYSGIWTGDNASWWNHILLNLKMLPSLNMCGYMFVGADCGGFGQNSTEDLVLRWTEFSIFTPLFRNHSACGTRKQEYFLMKDKDTIRNILSIRYAILPYLYSEFVKTTKESSMLYKPLSFVYSDDGMVNEIEDQIMFGESIMLAPIYTQNTTHRYVYLPEDMMEVRMRSAKDYSLTRIPKGDHILKAELDEVVFYIRRGYAVPINTEFSKNVYDIDYSKLSWIRNNDETYTYRLVELNDDKTNYMDKDVEPYE